MKKILFFLLFPAWLFGQTVVDPKDFPVEANPGQANFEFYTRKTGQNKKATWDGVRKGMTPCIRTVGYTPNTSGNTSDLGCIVTTPASELWYIAGNGDGVKIGGVSYTAGTGISLTGGVIANTGDLSSTNEIQVLSLLGQNLTLSNGGGTVTLPSFPAYTAGAGIAITAGVISNTGDKFTNNEGALTVSPGTDSTAQINSNTNGSTPITLKARGLVQISESGSTITLEVDSIPAFVQDTVTVVGGTGITVAGPWPNYTVTNAAPDQIVSITGAGITNVTGTYPNFTVTSNEVDGSTTNEPLTISVGANSETLAGQTLTVTGSGIITPTYTPATNTLNIAATEVDGSTTNEIQNLSLSGQSLGISGGGTGVTLPIVGVSAGTGIGVSVASGVATVTNTGDTNPGDDITTIVAGTGIGVSGTGNTRTISNTGDLSATNEGSLTVGAGTSTTSEIISNTSGSTPVTIQAGNGLNITETGNTIIMGINGGQDAWVYGGNSPGAIRSIGTNDGNALDIETNGVRRIRILPDGKIGVATTAPQTTMDFGEATDGITLPGGTIAQKVNVPRTLRYNTTYNGYEASNDFGTYMPINGRQGITVTMGTAVSGTGQLIVTDRADVTGVITSIRCGNAPTNNGIICTLTWAAGTYNRGPGFSVFPGGQASTGLQFWTSYGTNSVNIHVGGTLIANQTYPLVININP